MPDTHTSAADAYAQTSAEGDQRALEANALLKAARKLQAIVDKWDNHTVDELEEALVYNRKLWTIFAAETTNDEHPLPLEIKNNIANLGVFVFKRCFEIQLEPEQEKLGALIEINRNIAAGLMSNPQGPKPPLDEKTPPTQAPPSGRVQESV